MFIVYFFSALMCVQLIISIHKINCTLWSHRRRYKLAELKSSSNASSILLSSKSSTFARLGIVLLRDNKVIDWWLFIEVLVIGFTWSEIFLGAGIGAHLGCCCCGCGCVMEKGFVFIFKLSVRCGPKKEATVLCFWSIKLCDTPYMPVGVIDRSADALGIDKLCVDRTLCKLLETLLKRTCVWGSVDGDLTWIRGGDE